MHRAWIVSALILTAAGVATAAPRRTPFTNQSRPMRAQVTMLAVSSSSRQSFAGNQEIYLADLQTKDGNSSLVRLIDQYPGYGLPIRDSLLREQAALTMQVTREPECDIPASQIFLAPTERVIFNASVRGTLQARPGDLVPCYRTLHSTIRLVQK